MSASMNITSVVPSNTSKVEPVSKIAVPAKVAKPDVEQSLPQVKLTQPENDLNVEQTVLNEANNSQENSTTTLNQDILDISDYVQNTQRSLNFTVDDDSGQVIIKVIDMETNETIRQIPSEEIVALAEQIREHAPKSGNLFEAKA